VLRAKRALIHFQKPARTQKPSAGLRAREKLITETSYGPISAIAASVRYLMSKAFSHGFLSDSRLWKAGSSFGLLISLVLCSSAAMADVYPVDGVWVAMDTDFLADRDEACLALKTFGTEAVSKKSIPELIIFTKDKRYDVKGDVQNETTIKSIKEEDGGFRIIESLGKRKHWLKFTRNATYFLKVIDPQTIEIWDGASTRYTKCGSPRPPI
jgi:hypothetical protein